MEDAAWRERRCAGFGFRTYFLEGGKPGFAEALRRRRGIVMFWRFVGASGGFRHQSPKFTLDVGSSADCATRRNPAKMLLSPS
jgi:hypothetical protein